MKEILRIISRVFDDFDGGKISKQHLGMLSSRPNYEIQLTVKIIIICLSPNVFIRGAGISIIGGGGGGQIFIYSCSQTVKTIDFKIN